MRFALIVTLCLVGVASAGSLNKRFISEETFKQQSAEFKASLDKLREALLNRFQNNGDAEVTVEKRDLRESFNQFNKFAQTKTQEAFNNIRRVIDNLFKKNPFFDSDDDAEDTTERTIVKRNIFQHLERMNSQAQAQAQKVFDGLQRAFASIFVPFKPHHGNDDSEDSTERSISKRDIFEHFGRLNELAQAQAQKAFSDLQRVFDDLFKKHPGSHGIEIEIEDGEVTTERIIEKRDIFDFFGRINEKAQDEAAKVFAQLQKTFEDIFKHHDDEDEDSTESSIVKRDIFDFFGEINEKIQDQAGKFFNQFHKPGPKPAPKPVEDDDEIEVVTSA
ncbi:uncharacterized protein LOC107361325 [Tetranychus urticae]|uniref:SXP/RAL-2 family protein Ani s 5-like cation-binding domain-containing protein n=1 Tax=Tetranychus urticae TaxID=32264 RepID=T1K6E6_TETUR|nr:uncharacterized protein LOC107361325 [Tetranychus urticae]